jgi:hypothetical protein
MKFVPEKRLWSVLQLAETGAKFVKQRLINRHIIA